MEWLVSQTVGFGAAMAFNQDSPFPVLRDSWAKGVFMDVFGERSSPFYILSSPKADRLCPPGLGRTLQSHLQGWEGAGGRRQASQEEVAGEQRCEERSLLTPYPGMTPGTGLTFASTVTLFCNNPTCPIEI